MDVPGAVLLGERQLKFLDDWAADWTDAEMKVALSQTSFCGGAHIHGNVNGKLHADMGSNGWPITIHQTDNYARKAVAYLPTLIIKGQTNPVVQIIDESGDEIVYTL